MQMQSHRHDGGLAFADSEIKIYLRVNKFVPKLVSDLPSFCDPVYSLPYTSLSLTHPHKTLRPGVGWSIRKPHITRLLGFAYVLGLWSKQASEQRKLNLVIYRPDGDHRGTANTMEDEKIKLCELLKDWRKPLEIVIGKVNRYWCNLFVFKTSSFLGSPLFQYPTKMTCPPISHVL